MSNVAAGVFGFVLITATPTGFASTLASLSGTDLSRPSIGLVSFSVDGASVTDLVSPSHSFGDGVETPAGGATFEQLAQPWSESDSSDFDYLASSSSRQGNWRDLLAGLSLIGFMVVRRSNLL